ncbi:MAG: hypothetical protein FWE18_05810 [Alphaproteobacteria bacterium]|nr:hypothetical protein [Alphaproteobacteria bacterium]
MDYKNFISYLATGQDSFTCEFEVEFEAQIEVIIEDKQLVYLEDYTVENFRSKDKVVKLKEKLGSSLFPKLIILKRNAGMQRKTSFQDNSQIKANLLNLEFDNLIDNQNFLKDFLTAISRGLLIKGDGDTDGGGDCNCNCDCGNNGNTGGGEANSGVDPRDWEETVSAVDIEDSFDASSFKEVVIDDVKPLTHNTYFIYSSNPANLPDSTPYRITNFTKI